MRSPPSASRPSRVTQAKVYDTRMDGIKYGNEALERVIANCIDKTKSLAIARLHIISSIFKCPLKTEQTDGNEAQGNVRTCLC